jgi:hypothetical protein
MALEGGAADADGFSMKLQVVRNVAPIHGDGNYLSRNSSKLI